MVDYQEIICKWSLCTLLRIKILRSRMLYSIVLIYAYFLTTDFLKNFLFPTSWKRSFQMRWVQTKSSSRYQSKIKSLRFECRKKDCVEDEKRLFRISTGMFKKKNIWRKRVIVPANMNLRKHCVNETIIPAKFLCLGLFLYPLSKTSIKKPEVFWCFWKGVYKETIDMKWVTTCKLHF